MPCLKMPPFILENGGIPIFQDFFIRYPFFFQSICIPLFLNLLKYSYNGILQLALFFREYNDNLLLILIILHGDLFYDKQ